MIDRGLVSIHGKRLRIAREEFDSKTRFQIARNDNKIIYDDENLLVIDKSIGVESYALERNHSCKLINRLDVDTSGIILLAKNNATLKKAISEFKKQSVKKLYYALVQGKLCEEIVINKSISTSRGEKAISRIDKNGRVALSIVKPLRILGNKTLLEVEIKTGITHQIRVHLASIKYPIIGDVIYNNECRGARRMMLHCYQTSIFDKVFVSNVNIDKEFGLEGY